jgi:hypothetical protein
MTTGACHVDSTVNVLAHETVETTTDPYTPIDTRENWYFPKYTLGLTQTKIDEIADACQGEFYNQFPSPNNGTTNGQDADMLVNGDYYNVSGVWNAALNTGGNVCNPFAR